METAEPSQGIGASSRIARIPFRSLAALPAPRPAVLAAIAVAGVAAAATTLALGAMGRSLPRGRRPSRAPSPSLG
jgi:hypothetical protein